MGRNQKGWCSWTLIFAESEGGQSSKMAGIPQRGGNKYCTQSVQKRPREINTKGKDIEEACTTQTWVGGQRKIWEGLNKTEQTADRERGKGERRVEDHRTEVAVLEKGGKLEGRTDEEKNDQESPVGPREKLLFWGLHADLK